ncbi:hypothetical protein, partial [Aeromonas veronii]|uniref:hypothetical protein n=1 Tax=Aeromonas veronii TaxID=654 RepID=UPI003BA36602
KAFPNGKAFLLWAFLPTDPDGCTPESTKSPASRPGFCIFSALNHQYLAFPCQVRVPDSRLFPPFLSISALNQLHLQPFE